MELFQEIQIDALGSTYVFATVVDKIHGNYRESVHALGSTYVFATVVDKIHGNYREKSLQLKLRILHNNHNNNNGSAISGRTLPVSAS